MHAGHCDALGEPTVAPEDRPLHGDPRSTSPCFRFNQSKLDL